MRTQKKGTRSSRFRITTIAIAVASSFAMTPAWAADTAVGSGTGVAYGAGSNAPKAENVAIGKGATISYSNGASNATGDIVVGNGANVNNYASQGGSIAIGKMRMSKTWRVAARQALRLVKLPFQEAGSLLLAFLLIRPK